MQAHGKWSDWQAVGSRQSMPASITCWAARQRRPGQAGRGRARAEGRIPPSHHCCFLPCSLSLPLARTLPIRSASPSAAPSAFPAAATLMGLTWFRLYAVCMCVCVFALHLGQGSQCLAKVCHARSQHPTHQIGIKIKDFIVCNSFLLHFLVRGRVRKKCSILSSAD